MKPAATTADAALARASQGHRSALLSQALRLACKLASVPIIARLVPPEEHGLFAMGSSAFLLLALFRDAGLGVAAIQARTLSEPQKTALFWAHLFLGLLLTLAGCASAGAIARFYDTPAVESLFMTMSAAFLVIGASGFVRSQLGRAARFVELNRVENTAAILGTFAMIGSAILGAGAYAFVIFLLVSELIATALAWRTLRWRVHARPDWPGLRGLLGVGADVTVYQIVGYLLQQMDVIAVGRWFGSHTMGLYSRAGLLLSLPNLHLVGPLNQVALVTLSRLRTESPHFLAHAQTTVATIAHFVFPLFAVAIALPAETVRLVLGPEWFEATALVRWLALAAIGSTLVALGYASAVAAQQTRALAVSGAAAVPCTVLAIWLGRDRGAEGIAAAIATTHLVLALPRLWWSVRREHGAFAGLCSALLGPTIGSAIAIAGMRTGYALTQNQPWTIRLAGSLFTGAVAFILLATLWPRLRRELRAAWHYLPRISFRSPS